MKVTTKNMGNGRYVVFVDGQQTNLVIEKGEAAKFRCRQEWCIGIMRGDHPDWLIYDQPGLGNATATIRAILCAGLEIQRVAA